MHPEQYGPNKTENQTNNQQKKQSSPVPPTQQIIVISQPKLNKGKYKATI